MIKNYVVQLFAVNSFAAIYYFLSCILIWATLLRTGDSLNFLFPYLSSSPKSNYCPFPGRIIQTVTMAVFPKVSPRPFTEH
jgi:hypothetical protein